MPVYKSFIYFFSWSYKRGGGGQFRDAMSPTKLTPEPPYTCSITSKPRKTVDDLKVILLIMRLRRSYRGAEWPCTPSLATVCQEASLYFGQESGNHCQQEEIIHSEESRMEGVGGGVYKIKNGNAFANKEKSASVFLFIEKKIPFLFKNFKCWKP